MNSAYISEIFPTIQGEGIYVGERQLFIRFIGCNISCGYCDAEEIKKQGSIPCLLKTQNETESVQNPISIDKAADFISTHISKNNIYHSLCLTGGEPLLQVDFLKEFLPKIKICKYLETNGILYANLEEIIDFVDFIAMDIKIPSATGCSSYFSEHKKFLKIANLQKIFVKIVFSGETTPKEIEESCDVIREEDDSIPLVLQPVSQYRGLGKKATSQQCLNFQAIAKRKLKKVLVIPQVHKILGLP